MFASLLTILFISFAILSWRSLDWGIYLIIFALPSYLVRFELLGIPTTFLEIMVLILFAIWLVKKLKDLSTEELKNKLSKAFLAHKFISLSVLTFLLAATISVFSAPELQAAAGIWKAYFIEPVLFFIVFIHVIDSKERFKKVLWALGLSILIPGLLAVYQKFTGFLIPRPFWQLAETRRVTSFYGYPNAIGLYFAPIVTLLVGWFVNKFKTMIDSHAELVSASTTETLKPVQGDKKIWFGLVVLILLIIIGSLSIIFAQSKGAVLAIGLGVLFYALFWKGLRIYFVSLLVIGALGLFILSPSLLSLEGQKTVTGGGSLEVRTEQWAEAITMLKTRALWGAGLSGYQDTIAPYHTKDYIEIYKYPHQLILNFWTETGLLGLLAFIWLVLIFFKNLFNNYGLRITDYGLPVAGAMVALLAHGLVDVPYFKNDLSVLFWILFGLMFVIHFTQSNSTILENNV